MFMNGSMDNEGTLQARANFNLTKSLTAKTQFQARHDRQ
jgi:hypothetical protein